MPYTTVHSSGLAPQVEPTHVVSHDYNGPYGWIPYGHNSVPRFPAPHPNTLPSPFNVNEHANRGSRPFNPEASSFHGPPMPTYTRTPRVFPPFSAPPSLIQAHTHRQQFKRRGQPTWNSRKETFTGSSHGSPATEPISHRPAHSASISIGNHWQDRHPSREQNRNSSMLPQWSEDSVFLDFGPPWTHRNTLVTALDAWLREAQMLRRLTKNTPIHIPFLQNSRRDALNALGEVYKAADQIISAMVHYLDNQKYSKHFKYHYQSFKRAFKIVKRRIRRWKRAHAEFARARLANESTGQHSKGMLERTFWEELLMMIPNLVQRYEELDKFLKDGQKPSGNNEETPPAPVELDAGEGPSSADQQPKPADKSDKRDDGSTSALGISRNALDMQDVPRVIREELPAFLNEITSEELSALLRGTQNLTKPAPSRKDGMNHGWEPMYQYGSPNEYGVGFAVDRSAHPTWQPKKEVPSLTVSLEGMELNDLEGFDLEDSPGGSTLVNESVGNLTPPKINKGKSKEQVTDSTAVTTASSKYAELMEEINKAKEIAKSNEQSTRKFSSGGMWPWPAPPHPPCKVNSSEKKSPEASVVMEADKKTCCNHAPVPEEVEAGPSGTQSSGNSKQSSFSTRSWAHPHEWEFYADQF